MAYPSAYPRDQARPALVVAMACAPQDSMTRALPASQAFGRSSGVLVWCSCRKRAAAVRVSMDVFLLGARLVPSGRARARRRLLARP